LEFFQNAPAETITIGWDPKNKHAGQVYLTFPSLDNDFFPGSLEELRKEAPRKQTITGMHNFFFVLWIKQYKSVFDFRCHGIRSLVIL
jgi:hypothetical protein